MRWFNKFLSMAAARWVFLVVLVALIVTAVVASNHNSGRFYDANRRIPTDSLVSLASKMLDEELYDSAAAYYTIIISRAKLEENPDDARSYLSAYNNLGYIYASHYADLPGAYGFFTNTIEVCQKYGIPYVSNAYINLGNIHYMLSDTLRGIQENRKAFQMAVKERNSLSLALSFVNLSLMALESHRLDSISDFTAMLDTSTVMNGHTLAQTLRLCNDGVKSYMKRDYPAALESFRKMQYSVDERFLRHRIEACALACRALTADAAGDLNQEIALWQSLDSMAVATSDRDMLDFMSQARRGLAKAYARNGDPEASLQARNRAIEVEEDLLNYAKIGKIYEIRGKHETDELHLVIVEIEAKRRMQTIIIWLSSVFGLLILGLCFWLWRLYKDQKRKNRELYRRNVELIEQYDRAKAQTILEMTSAEPEQKRYSGSSLGEEEKSLLMQRITSILDTSDAIYSNNFTLDNLAELVGSNPKYVSQVVNEVAGKNFSTLLAEYRIREAARRLAIGSGYDHLTIEAIASELGFKSRSNFSILFKKATGLTPTDYRKASRPQ